MCSARSLSVTCCSCSLRYRMTSRRRRFFSTSKIRSRESCVSADDSSASMSSSALLSASGSSIDCVEGPFDPVSFVLMHLSPISRFYARFPTHFPCCLCGTSSHSLLYSGLVFPYDFHLVGTVGFLRCIYFVHWQALNCYLSSKTRLEVS